MTEQTKIPFYAKASLICIGLFTFIVMLYIARPIIVPIIYATILSMVLSPVVNFFMRKKVPRIFAITITIIPAIMIIIGLSVFIASQAAQFSDSLPVFMDKFHEFITSATAWASANFNISTDKINSWLYDTKNNMLSNTSFIIGRTLSRVGNAFVVMVLIPVYIFMILYYQPLLLEFIRKLFGKSNEVIVNELLTGTKSIIQSFLTGLLIEAAIIAILNSSGLLIIGIDYAILFGIMGALLNIIPFIGGIAAVAFPFTIALITRSPATALYVLALYAVVQFIDNHYIMPKIVASKVRINALISIIAVISGGALWGVAGMFLSIPLTGIVKLICDHIPAMKPWGYLLGDTMPGILKIKRKRLKFVQS